MPWQAVLSKTLKVLLVIFLLDVGEKRCPVREVDAVDFMCGNCGICIPIGYHLSSKVAFVLLICHPRSIVYTNRLDEALNVLHQGCIDCSWIIHHLQVLLQNEDIIPDVERGPLWK